jgi:hypothetical protein
VFSRVILERFEEAIPSLSFAAFRYGMTKRRSLVTCQDENLGSFGSLCHGFHAVPGFAQPPWLILTRLPGAELEWPARRNSSRNGVPTSTRSSALRKRPSRKRM